jgi:hypothetical protein
MPITAAAGPRDRVPGCIRIRFRVEAIREEQDPRRPVSGGSSHAS